MAAWGGQAALCGWWLSGGSVGTALYLAGRKTGGAALQAKTPVSGSLFSGDRLLGSGGCGSIAESKNHIIGMQEADVMQFIIYGVLFRAMLQARDGPLQCVGEGEPSLFIKVPT